MAHHRSTIGPHPYVKLNRKTALPTVGKEGERPEQARASGPDNLRQEKVQIPLKSPRLFDGLNGRYVGRPTGAFAAEPGESCRENMAPQRNRGGDQAGACLQEKAYGAWLGQFSDP